MDILTNKGHVICRCELNDKLIYTPGCGYVAEGDRRGTYFIGLDVNTCIDLGHELCTILRAHCQKHYAAKKLFGRRVSLPDNAEFGLAINAHDTPSGEIIDLCVGSSVGDRRKVDVYQCRLSRKDVFLLQCCKGNIERALLLRLRMRQ